MNFHDEKVLVGEFEGTNIMILATGETFDIYYQKPGYPYIFAFGLPYTQGKMQTHYSDAIDIACANVENYECLFD